MQYGKCICCIKINLPKFYIPRISKRLIVGGIEELKIESSNEVDCKKAASSMQWTFGKVQKPSTSLHKCYRTCMDMFSISIEPKVIHGGNSAPSFVSIPKLEIVFQLRSSKSLCQKLKCYTLNLLILHPWPNNFKQIMRLKMAQISGPN